MTAAPALTASASFHRLAEGPRAFLILAAIALAAALAGLFSVPTLDRDEGRFAQATAQMLESGDFVRIRYLDAERNRKPAGAHWLQAASVAALSDPAAREIWAYRLPSALAAVAATLAAFWGGIAAVGRPAAFLGALLFAPSALLAAEGQIAKTDALLCAACALALAGLARLRHGDGRAAALAFWAGIGLGILIKGPVAPLVAGLAMGAVLLWERRWDWARPLAWWPGPLLAAAIALPWWIAIGVVTEGRFYADSLLGDAGSKVTGGAEHPPRPPGLHTLLLPLLIFPATLGLPAAAALAINAARAPRDAPDAAGVRLLLAWAAPTFVMFELAAAKLAHYTLPAFPAIALLAGAGLLAPTPGWTRPAGVALALAAAGTYVALAGELARYGGVGPDMTWSCGAVALVSFAIGLWATGRSAGRTAAVCVAAGLFLAWGLREGVLPRAERLFPGVAAERALAASGLRAPGATVWLIGYAEPSLVFALGPGAATAAPEVAATLAAEGDAAIIEAAAAPAFQRALLGRGLSFQPAGEAVDGLHVNNGGRTVRLQGGRIAARP